MCAGLDGDFQRSVFGGMVSLVPVADEVMKLAATCFKCGGRAAFSLRRRDPALSAQGLRQEKQELVGGAEKYVAACRTCYLDAEAPGSSSAASPAGAGHGLSAAAFSSR